jgi:hypothetical protein
MALHHSRAKERPMPPRTITSNTLFYGDNLGILREHISDVDWYAYWREDGKLKKKYIGKELHR